MHLAAMRAAQVGRTEAEVAAAVQRVVQAEDGYPSFPIILTVRGEILHNPRHENILQNGQLVLCDAGAQTRRCYAADMTRTFPVAATFSSRQRDIYGVVLRAQEAAIDALRPGVLFRDVHLLAARTIAEGLKDLGLMKGDVAAAVTQGAHALFFPHGLGHMMGLDVHDMEDLGEDYVGYEDFARSRQFGLKSLRLARTLKPGFVLTIEPGVYFIPALIDRWRSEGKFGDFIAYDAVEAFKDFSGVRIEEDYLITEGGSHLLGKPAPKSIEEIEAIRGGAVSA
jgi:Xaa-Pro aminopeptidase